MGLDALFNPKDEMELKKKAFQIFDINKDGRLSERDMFDLMNMCQAQSHKGKGEKDDHVKAVGIETIKIVGLDQRMSDLFLDVFAGDYIKIMKEMERKKEAKGIS